MRARTAMAACGSMLMVMVGCGAKQPEPTIVSSAGAPSYAIDYPQHLTTETTLLTADKQRASELTQQLATRPTALKPDADPGLLLVVVQQSDVAGRGEACARANDDARALRAFWEDERGPIAARANSAAQKSLAEGKCAETDLSNPISYALTSGVNKQLEKRIRACNEAQQTIDRNKHAFGAGNLNAVQQLADDIALASYLVNVALPEDRNRVDGLLSERGDIESTLDRAIEWEQRYQAGNPPNADKRASQEQLAVLQKSREAVPQAASGAEAARKDIDKFIEDARKRYDAALDALEDALKAEQARAEQARDAQPRSK